MKTQIFNPYLPSWEYIPDVEPYVFDSRLYLYGSHDRFSGEAFCLNDYVCWSADVNDLAHWRFEGIIYRKEQDPINPDGKKCLYAPDVQQGLDGRYYLYYSLHGSNIMSVAVSETPAGVYRFYGHVRQPDGHIIGSDPKDILQFDPAVFIDDDGRIFLYSGFSPRQEMKEAFGIKHRTEGAYLMELEADMLTVKQGPTLLIPGIAHAAETSFADHAFFEASSLRKIDGRYYFIYASIHGHELCYAISDHPDRDFRLGGTLISNGDVFLDGRTLPEALNYTGNNHGSLVQIQGQWYVFYHRQTNFHHYSRQNCAEKIHVDGDGQIAQVAMTSCGLNDGALRGVGTYPARIACNLESKNGAIFYDRPRKDPKEHPYFTQDEADHEGQDDGIGQYIANFGDGALAGFKYFSLASTRQVGIKVRGMANGQMLVMTDPEGKPNAQIAIAESEKWQYYKAPFNPKMGVQALYFTFSGQGKLDFLEFTLT